MECTVQIDKKKNKIYAPLKEQWFVKTPEEEVRQLYICRLVNHYGFSLDQMKQEVTVSNSSRGQDRAQADIVVWKSQEEGKSDKINEESDEKGNSHRIAIVDSVLEEPEVFYGK